MPEVRGAGVDNLEDGIEAGGHIPRSKQRRENVHALAHAARLPPRFRALGVVHLSHPFRGRISLLYREFAFRREISQHACPATNPVADLHLHIRGRIENYVGPRPEFDQPHTLTAIEAVAYFRIKDDAPGQQSGNLLENDSPSVTFHADDILFILFGGSFIHRVQKFSTLITNLADKAGDRRTVHMNVKNTQKDADAKLFFTAYGYPRNICDLPIRGRNYCIRDIWN